MSELYPKIYTEFKKKFHTEPIMIRAPGRVNLIGEHTDYNDGFVLPAAIDPSIVLAIAPNKHKRIRLKAVDMQEDYFEIPVSGSNEKSKTQWVNYILGVVTQLNLKGYNIEGFDCVFGGDIPIGAGLSSSAALEGGVVFGISEIFDLGIEKQEMVLTGQHAENNFVGVQCGIMDQFANIYGKKDHVIQLDCRSLDHTYYPFHQDTYSIVLFDSNVHRELAGSEYNIRRNQCEEGVRIIRKKYPEVQKLRDVSPEKLAEYQSEMDPVVYKRCLFIVEENQRVRDACKDLSRGDLKAFGEKMYNSHKGLRDLYEVSCRELDLLVNVARNNEAIIGTRMMGGGFGGCTINLVSKDQIKQVITEVKRLYKKQTGKNTKAYTTGIADGTALISLHNGRNKL